MKKTISTIDRALKNLYNLQSALEAKDFLIQVPPVGGEAPPAGLYIDTSQLDQDTLSMGIYLSPKTASSLETFSSWSSRWTLQQFSAFGHAAEEISHFRYVAHHAPQGRSVSQLELEFQGEIDKFLLAFFALNPTENAGEVFSSLWDRFFKDFQWRERLGSEEKVRYEEANRLAKAFLVKHASLIQSGKSKDKLLKLMRDFYRLSMEEKVSRATR